MERSVLTARVMRSILCPVDFSDPSRTALHVAARFVGQFTAALHVLFVEDPLLAPAIAVQAPVAPDLTEELTQFVVSTLDVELPIDPVLHVVTGDPAKEIVRLADCEQVDALVMGIHGLTGVQKAFFGSTTARVLRGTTRTLVMVPAAVRRNHARNLAGLGSILVLTDFGPASSCAATAAARLAESVGARLVLVHVVPVVSAPASWSSRAEAAVEYRETDAHQRMCRAMAPLEKHGPVESVIVQGNVAARVAELVQSSHAGLIVMGLNRDARGSRPGSTANAVMCSASVPVLVMPAAAANGNADARVDRANAREGVSAATTT
ncbi:MAG: universal stress protein [Acidobacteria bacterium]|nr:universal stress protein [Acidobacteriota bacterium]